jgi:putative acetyltransferase
VWPDKQRKGIGSALINEGLAILRANGAKGCVLIGDPAYYGRFGFRSDGNLSYQDLPAQYVQSLPFQNETANGQLKFSPAFNR